VAWAGAEEAAEAEAAALSTSGVIHLCDLIHAQVEEGEARAALDAVKARQPALRHRQPLQMAHRLQRDDLRDRLQIGLGLG